MKNNVIVNTGKNKLGNYVYYTRFGQQCARVYLDKIKNPNTEKQQINRAKLALLVAIGHAFLLPIRVGLGKYASTRKMTASNAFAQINYDDITGQTPDSVMLDPSLIQISKGSVPGIVSNAVLNVAQPGTIKITVDNSNYDAPFASTSDDVYAVAFCPDTQETAIGVVAKRTNNLAQMMINVPHSWSGLEAHVYTFVKSEYQGYEGQTSNTEYVGHAEVN